MRLHHFCCLLSILFFLQTEAQSRRPNIIFMMSDDHGYQAISAYGHGLNNTPQIDRLAKEGVRFDRAYVTNALCGPSRAVMLTGKHSHINGFKDNHSIFDGTQPTVATHLHQAGYQTAVVGKWHLASDPQGFDYWNILPGQGDYYQPDFIENGIRKKTKGYVTHLTTDFAINWLEQRDKSRPFFLIYQQKAPHRNWMPEPKYFHLFDSTQFPVPSNFFDDYQTRSRAAKEQEMEIATHMHAAYDLKLRFDIPPEERKGLAASWHNIFNRMTPDEKQTYEAAYSPSIAAFQQATLSGRDLAIWKYQRYMREYLRCVQSIDDEVGRLMDYLRQQGLEENTIIIYTSDQGFFLGEHGWFDKRWMYEESFRTPLIVKGPGILQGRSTTSMVQNLDLAETILDLAGLPVPADMQGKSFKPLLQGKKGGHDQLYYHFYENEEHRVAKHIGIRTKRYKLIFFYEKQEWELYDLDKDPREMQNVFSDPNYKKIREDLRTQLMQLKQEYNDPEPAKLE